VQGCTNIAVAGCKRAWNNGIIEYPIFSITYRAIARSTDEFRFKPEFIIMGILSFLPVSVTRAFIHEIFNTRKTINKV